MKTNLLKSVISLIASAGVGVVVTNAVKSTTPEDLKTINKIAIVVGTFVASNAIGNLASDYTSKQIDEVAGSFNEAKTALKAKKNS